MSRQQREEEEEKKKTPQEALADCLLSQYAMTFAGVSCATGYAVWKKPPNGLPLMILAGAAGSLLDLTYGFTTACRPQVEAWRNARDSDDGDEE